MWLWEVKMYILSKKGVISGKKKRIPVKVKPVLKLNEERLQVWECKICVGLRLCFKERNYDQTVLL